MNWPLTAAIVTAACAVIGLLIKIAMSLMEMQKHQSEAFSDIQLQLAAKLSIDDHFKICESRDGELRDELTEIKTILKGQDSRSLKIEESHSKFRDDTHSALQLITTDIAVMKAVRNATDRSVIVNSSK